MEARNGRQIEVTIVAQKLWVMVAWTGVVAMEMEKKKSIWI